MVGMSTGPGNNHIGWSGIGGMGKHKLSGVVTQVLQGRFRPIDDPTAFLKTRCAKSLFQYFTTRTEKAPPLRRNGFVLAIIGRCVLEAQLGVGGGRIQMG